MKFIQRYIYGFYLGFALSVFANVHFYEWRFYAIGIPLFLLAEWSRGGDN